MCTAALYRRYLDMIVTPGVVDTLKARSKAISTMRRMLEGQGEQQGRAGQGRAGQGRAACRPGLACCSLPGWPGGRPDLALSAQAPAMAC
jgi:hypothetical protein